MYDEVRKEKMKSFYQAVGLAVYFCIMFYVLILIIGAVFSGGFTMMTYGYMAVFFIGMVYLFYLLLEKP